MEDNPIIIIIIIILFSCKTLDCLAIVECLKEKLNSDSNPTILVSNVLLNFVIFSFNTESSVCY